MAFRNNATVVLVHGAWADGSSWETVINSLSEAGLGVICAPLPLTTLTDDAAAVKRAIAHVDGPVILVAHAYAGAVIASVDDEKVNGLVYITALAPDEGETTAEVFYREAPHPDAHAAGLEYRFLRSQPVSLGSDHFTGRDPGGASINSGKAKTSSCSSNQATTQWPTFLRRT